jgi:molybdate transport system ATP-binding protein
MVSAAVQSSSAEGPAVRARLRVDRDAGAGAPAFRLDARFELPAGRVSALWGPSGSGKSTCLRLLAGLERGAGEVHVLGECWQDDSRGVFVPVHRRSVGCVFQEHALFAHLTVGGNLHYGRARSRGPARIDRDHVVRVLGLAPLLGRSPRGLSGGERQRVAIAQALLAQPKLLLLDEPLAALDGARKAELIEYLERLRAELSIPMVFVSHAIDEVARLADHVVVLDAGQVVGSGPIGETLARLDLPTARLDDAGAIIDAKVVSHDARHGLTQIAFDGGTLWVGGVDRPIGAPVRARALARDVSLALEAPGPSSILNVLPARVVEVRESGPHVVTVRLAVGEGGVALLARITRRSQDALGIRAGLDVHAQIKSVALFA